MWPLTTPSASFADRRASSCSPFLSLAPLAAAPCMHTHACSRTRTLTLTMRSGYLYSYCYCLPPLNLAAGKLAHMHSACVVAAVSQAHSQVIQLTTAFMHTCHCVAYNLKAARTRTSPLVSDVHVRANPHGQNLKQGHDEQLPMKPSMSGTATMSVDEVATLVQSNLLAAAAGKYPTYLTPLTLG